jgi:hypothetical protein
VGGGQRQEQKNPAGHCGCGCAPPALAPPRCGAACELGEGELIGHIKPRKTTARFLEFCRYLGSLYLPNVRIAIVSDKFGPH